MSEKTQGQVTSPTSEDLATQVKELREKLAETESRRVSAEISLTSKDSELRKLTQRWTDLQLQMTGLFVENQRLRFWLSRYKALKDKFLPHGSFQERIAKWAALTLTHQRATKTQASTARARTETRSSITVDGFVEPPQAWRGDPLRPPVVIAILNWNRVDLLRGCVESLFAHTGYERLRICIYDQASTDGSREYLQSLGDRIDTILGTENVGFITANNSII